MLGFMEGRQHTDAVSSVMNKGAMNDGAMNNGADDARTNQRRHGLTVFDPVASRVPFEHAGPPACDKLLTLADVARRLNVKIKSVYNWRSKGYVIPGEVRIGPQTIRFRARDLEAWIAAGGLKRKRTSHEGRQRTSCSHKERAQDVPICKDASAPRDLRGGKNPAGVDGPAPAAS
jgi:predicted DNA-binding transcriptional regulator AlpA